MAEAQAALSPELYTLFSRLQPSELAHSINVFRSVRQQSEDPDLLAAALLHDVGKIVVPLGLWEKVFIVLVRKFGLQRFFESEESLDSKPAGPARGLVVAERHPAWGAQLAHRAGANRTVVQLIRRHQDPLPPEPESREDELLAILKAADEAN
jgi:hypothetical protein